MRVPAPARRRTAVVALVLLGGLTGCSGGDEKDYCAAWAEERVALAELDAGGDLVTPVLSSYERLREVAPEDLADEYSTLVIAYQALADAIDEAGVDPADYDVDRRPDGVTPAEARQLAAVASKLDAPRVRQAAAGIEDHADQVCGDDSRTGTGDGAGSG